MPMFWETTPPSGTWRQTEELWVWHTGAWQLVKAAWIWSGSQWELCHTAAASLNSFILYDASGVCNPTLGTFQATWAYTSAVPSEWSITLEYSFDFGSSWQTYASGLDLTSGSYTGSLDGYFGFTSLDSTYFRLSMVSGSTQATNSPSIATPPYTCL